MMDDYDLQHSSKYKSTINFYCGDLDQDIENTIKSVCIDIDEKYKKEFCERVIQTINKLKNSLSILDYRSITNLGARVHCCNPNNYNEDFGSKPDWYLVQVWRG